MCARARVSVYVRVCVCVRARAHAYVHVCGNVCREGELPCYSAYMEARGQFVELALPPFPGSGFQAQVSGLHMHGSLLTLSKHSLALSISMHEKCLCTQTV